MFLEVVKFGNGTAIEIVNMMSRALLYYHFGVVLKLKLPNPLPSHQNFTALELCDFVQSTLATIAASDLLSDANPRQRQWLFMCSDINPLTPKHNEKFEAKCVEVFGEEHQIIKPSTPEGEIREQVGGELRQRCWLLDTCSGRTWCVKFQFASPIYQSTVLEGSITPVTDQQPATFHINNVRLWCGAEPQSDQFIRQQLNIWFCTPMNEQCWHRSSSNDVFKFVVDIPTASVSVDTSERLPVLSLRPQSFEIGKWNECHRVESSRIFRIYKTQYPFIYTLMPDDDERVTHLKAELKNSTGALQPLVITIPTVECELAVRAAFKRNPKHIYIRWRCAKYITASGKNDWIPISEAV